MSEDIQSVAVIGAGVIGASWASLFLSHGLDVHVVDPRPGAEDELRAYIDEAWKHLAELRKIPEKPPAVSCRYHVGIASVPRSVGFVQECGPDRIGAKRELVAEIEAVIGSAVPIASSTSSLLASDIQEGARYPGRILVAHPMNPPHLIPLVELVAGKLTTPEAMDRAQAFYDAIGRVTIRVQKERIGHLANRLTSALYREAVNIVAEGIGTVEDVDKAIAWGPGMRWAFMGPHLIYHLGGGKGGYRHYLEHLGPTQAARWQELGEPELTSEVIEALLNGLEVEIEGVDQAKLEQGRDAALVALAKLKGAFPV